MRWLNMGLCFCCILLNLTACSQDKKLPQGTRLSILDDYGSAGIVPASGKSLTNLPAARVNPSWNQTGINPQHIVGNLKAGFSLKEQWSENFGKGVNKRNLIMSAPVVHNGKVFVMDSRGLVSAFSLKDGRRLWKNTLTASIGGFKETKSRAAGLAVDDKILYATTGFGGVFAMNTETGESLWRRVMESPIRIAPTVTAKMLLVQTVDNTLYALDRNNGKELWKFSVAQEDTVIAGGASPAYDADENVVVAGFSNGEIVVLNAVVGTPLWSSMLVANRQVSSSTDINTIGACPIVENGIIYAISNSNILQALDLHSGDKVWEKEIGSMQNMLMAGNYLFIISNRNILYAVEKNNGDVLWSLDVKEYLYEDDDNSSVIYAAPPLMLSNNLLLAFSNGKVLKINATDGKIIAKTDLGMDISNGLIAVQEKVIAVSDDADLIVFK